MDTLNSAEDLAGAHFTDQDYDNLTNKEYDNLRRDKQFIFRKYESSLKQLTVELSPDIIIEKE